MVVSAMAARRNAAYMETLSSGVSRERGRQFANPQLAYDRFSQKASEMLTELKPKVAHSEAILDRVRLRHESGELDLMSLGAEVAAAKVVVKMNDALTSMYLRAQNGKDTWAMRRIAVAAEKLVVQADEILKESSYPGDPTVKKMIISQNLAMAKEVYNDVVRSLDNTHLELGVAMPDFPKTTI